jgi:hypothetical protein
LLCATNNDLDAEHVEGKFGRTGERTMKIPWDARDKHKQELDEEIEAHLQLAARERESRGEPAAQAAACARRELGNPALVHDLGYVDLEEKILQPLDNLFGPKVLPMS